MKKILKYMGIIIIIGLFVGLISLILLCAVSSHKNQSTSNSSASIQIDYNGNGESPYLDKPEPIYADTMKEALTYNANYYFEECPYANKVDNIIKVFENDKYALMFYQSIKSKKREVFVTAKFKVRNTNGKKQYAITLLTLEELTKGGWRLSPLENMQCNAPLYDYEARFGINEGDRFFFDNSTTEKVKTLKIEGQSPTQIIEYTSLGKKEYFFYYKNIVSDKPSSEFDIEMEE